MSKLKQNGRTQRSPGAYGQSTADGAESRRMVLAVLQPDGTTCGGEEATMWERSQVERLTGLSRHMIQDLCYHNTKGGGLGFWEPAVSKPGYSRFDEGDLLMFYLVGQLKRAGFTLREVEPTVFAILENDDSLVRTLQGKADELHARRAELADQLSALECLKDAVSSKPADRLYAVMEAVLVQSVDRAVEDAGQGLDATREEVDTVHALLLDVARGMMGELRYGADCFDAADDMSGAQRCLGEARASVANLLRRGMVPTGPVACGFVRRVSRKLARRCALDTPVETRAHADLIMRALAHVLGDVESGVPVELLFGNGSYAFLSQAFRACTAGAGQGR